MFKLYIKIHNCNVNRRLESEMILFEIIKNHYQRCRFTIQSA